MIHNNGKIVMIKYVLNYKLHKNKNRIVNNQQKKW